MNLALFADGNVGMQITDWLLQQFPGDLSLVVATEENDILRSVQKCSIPALVYQSEPQIISFAAENNISCDLGILSWWPKIIRKALLGFPQHGFINTHPSLLPFNRGKHYNFWALVEQAPFGVTLHMVEEGIDNGDIVAQREISYDWEDNGESLYRRAQLEMVALFKDAYPQIRELSFSRKQQDLSEGSFHHSSELGPASQIDLNQTYKGADLLNRLRARTFQGHPSCWFEADGNKYEVRIEIRRIEK